MKVTRPVVSGALKSSICRDQFVIPYAGYRSGALNAPDVERLKALEDEYAKLKKHW